MKVKPSDITIDNETKKFSTRRAKLSDVAEEVRGSWKGDADGVPIVGLEHLEPEEIWLRHWALNPVENTFTKAFRKGQMLFGRRRAYQKKLSVAPCDGICSGDIMVIAAKADKILPELLPFYLRSEKFFDYAMKGSGGSLSPRVKWAYLADYEFDLPDLARQKELAELLWAANDLKEKYKKMIAASDEMLKAKFREMFGECGEEGAHGAAEVRSVKLEECGDIFTGSTPTMKKAEYWENDEIPFFKPSDFGEGLTMLNNSEYFADKRAVPVCRMFDSGDVLMTCIATIGKVGVATCRGTCNQQINFIKPNEKCETIYLAYVLSLIGPRMAFDAKSSVVPIINKTEFSKIEIPLPPLVLQRQFVTIAEKVEAVKAGLKKSIAEVDAVIKGLING